MKMSTIYYILCISILFTGCKPVTESLEEMEITLEKKVQKSITSDYLSVLKTSETDLNWLAEYYQSNEYKTLWINDTIVTESGVEVERLINNTRLFAIPLNRYDFLNYYDTLSIFQKEQYTTLKLAYLLNDLKYGLIDTAENKLFKPQPVSKKYFSTFVNNKEQTVTWEDYILESIPQHPKFKATLKGLNNFVKNFPLDTTTFKITSMKEDSVKAYSLAKQALFSKGFLQELEKDDSTFLESLKAFQRQNALKDDAIIGKYTARALNESNAQRYERGILALEKWRWKPELPNKYIWVNIPSYKLNLYINDSLKRVHRVVVGANETKTPEFKAKMKTIVSYPFWHIPYSIASTEILSGAKKDTNYFKKKGYKIFRSGEEVDPKTVDWSVVNETNFRYRVRQDGGYTNSLGIVKMLFPNQHSVYIHDTPAKRYFANDIRAYSHGCIRCQDPKDLAKYILERDNNTYNSDSLDALIAREQMQHIALRNPFYVYIDYISVGVNMEGSLQFYIDIYNHDKKWLALLRNEDSLKETD